VTRDVRRPATSAAVAARAGVSRTTVSYILNGKSGVSFRDETRESVLRAVDELGYHPNPAARSLADGSGPVVFVASSEPLNEVTSAAFGPIAQAFARHGILSTLIRASPDARRAVDDLVALRPRAVAFVFPPGEHVERWLASEGIRVIAMPFSLASLSVGEAQVSYLVAQGHDRLAIADVRHADHFGVLGRAREVATACAERGLPEPPIAGVNRNGEGARELVEQWTRAGVTAVCAYNDEIALAVLHGVREAGLRCPDDLAVIGCDDLTVASVAAPPLTTVGFEVTTGLDDLVAEMLAQLGIGPAPDTLAAPIARVIVRQSA